MPTTFVSHPDTVNLCTAVMLPALRNHAPVVTSSFMGVMTGMMTAQGFKVFIVGDSLEESYYDSDLVKELLEFAKYLTSEEEVRVTVEEYFKYMREMMGYRHA